MAIRNQNAAFRAINSFALKSAIFNIDKHPKLKDKEIQIQFTPEQKNAIQKQSGAVQHVRLAVITGGAAAYDFDHKGLISAIAEIASAENSGVKFVNGFLQDKAAKPLSEFIGSDVINIAPIKAEKVAENPAQDEPALAEKKPKKAKSTEEKEDK